MNILRMNILGKSIWKPSIAVWLVMLITGCSQHQPPTASPAPAGTSVASNVPIAPPAANLPQTFQPYTLLPQPAPKPKVVTHKERTLKLTLRNKHPYLSDAAGHYYEVGRDRQGHICPIYRDPKTKSVYPLYYDPSRDRMYRVAQADDGRYYRGYVGDPDNRFYASETDYTNDTDYEASAPAERPVIIDSYNTYNTYKEGAPYYGNYPASTPAIHHHHNNDNWLWAIPVVVGAYLLLNPHHHHDHHRYTPQPQAIFRQQPPGRDFNQGPPFVTSYPGHGGYPGHGNQPSGQRLTGPPGARQPWLGTAQHSSSRPPTAFSGFSGRHAGPPHQPVTRQIGNPARRLPLVPHSVVHPAVRHFTRPTANRLRPVHVPVRTVVHPERRLPTAIHRAAAPAHHTPVFVRPRVRKPITPRELIRPQTRRPNSPPRQFVRPARHTPIMPRQVRPARPAPPIRRDIRLPKRSDAPRIRPALTQHQRPFTPPRQRPAVQRSVPRPTPPRPEQHSQPHSPPRTERRPEPQNRPAPPRPQNRPAPPRNHPPRGGQNHDDNHPDHTENHHH